MNSIQSLVESANPWKNLQSDAARLAKKWSVTGLLEGAGNETNKNNMALLLENQAKQLVIESSQTGTGASFSVGQSETWAGIALPLVRKVFGQIAAKEFVSVQPMNLPSGLVFFLDFQYGTTKSPFTTGGSMYGERNPNGTYPFQTTAASGGLYGAGRFSYSENTFTGSVAYTASIANSSTFGTAAVAGNSASIQSASWAEIGFDSDFSSSVAAGQLYKITISSSMLTNADLEGARSFLITSGAIISTASNFPQFTKVDTTSYGAITAITFFVTASANFTNFAAAGNSVAGGTGFIVTYNKQTTDAARGDFESGSTAATTNNALSNPISIPEINIKMQSQAIVAKTRKLKAVWTPEFAQDLNAYQNIDAEAELTNIMSEYISMEIDLEILDMLIADTPASNTDYWSAINNTVYNGTTMAANSATPFYNTQGQWFQTLGTKIQKISNKIHQLTLRGGANFMVMSPTVATILESIPGFASTSNGDAAQMEYAFGVQKVGNLNSRYNVYKNPYMTENVILLGFRGSQFLEAGAVFAPYIPLIMTPLVYDPETFVPRKGLLTRYAKKMLRPEFYGKIYISGLNTI
jgi:hypothetical protein